MIKAIFFDLGSTLWDDYPAELHQWSIVVRLLERHGVHTSLEKIESLVSEVVASYCPSLTRSIVWKLLNGNEEVYWQLFDELIIELKQTYSDPSDFMRLNPLFPGVPLLLEQLAAHYPLAIVSQHFTEAEHWMEVHGIAKYFNHLAISLGEQLYKPDPRLYLSACAAMQVDPSEVMMVGDRLDNDIWPANRLKMVSVRVLADPYRRQIPRYHLDMPRFTIENVTELPRVLDQLH